MLSRNQRKRFNPSNPETKAPPLCCKSSSNGLSGVKQLWMTQRGLMISSILQRHSGHRPSFRFLTLCAHFSHILLCPQGCKIISGGHSRQMQHSVSSSSKWWRLASGATDGCAYVGVDVGSYLTGDGCDAAAAVGGVAAFKLAAGGPGLENALGGTDLAPLPCDNTPFTLWHHAVNRI